MTKYLVKMEAYVEAETADDAEMAAHQGELVITVTEVIELDDVGMYTNHGNPNNQLNQHKD